MTPSETFQAEMAGFDAALKEARRAQSKVDRLVALRIADIIVRQFERVEALALIRIETSEQEYDNGWFVTVDRTVGLVKDARGETDEDLDFEDEFDDICLGPWRDEFLEDLEIERSVVERAGFDREKVAGALGLLPGEER